MDIGLKVKSLRKQHGLTQEELASRCELSKGFISMLENDLTSPSIKTMQDLLEVFGLTMSEFFSEEQSEVEVVYFKNDYFTNEIENCKIEYLVSDAQSRELEPLKITLEPRGETEEISPHEGDMFGYVLKGKVSLILGEDSYNVNEGDSFYFSKPTTTQKIRNKSSVSNATLIWVSTPPIF